MFVKAKKNVPVASGTFFNLGRVIQSDLYLHFFCNMICKEKLMLTIIKLVMNLLDKILSRDGFLGLVTFMSLTIAILAVV